MTRHEVNKLLECVNELKKENAKLKHHLDVVANVLAEQSPCWLDCTALDKAVEELESAGYDLGYRGEGEPTICGDSQEGHE